MRHASVLRHTLAAAWFVLLPSALLAQSQSSAAPVPPPDSQQAGSAPEVGPVLPSKPMTGTFFGQLQLHDLPGSRTLWTLVETADELTIVDRIENGGLYLGEPKLMGSLGSPGAQAGFTLNGLDITNPGRTGTPLAYPDAFVLGSLEVVSSLPSVDLAGGGPTVALMPRAPARTWGGGFDAAFMPQGLQASAEDKGIPAIAHFGSAGEGGFTLSGPVGPAAGILLTGRHAVSHRFERADPSRLDSSLTSLFLHSTFNTPSSGRIRVLASADAAKHPFAGRMRFPDRTVTARDRFYNVQGVWEKATEGGTTWSLAAGYDRGALGAPGSTDASSPTIGVIERLRDGPVFETVSPSAGVQTRLSEVLRVRPDLGRSTGGRYTLDLGLSLSRTSSTNDAMPEAIVGEVIDGTPARVWDYTWGGTSSRHATELAGWINEQVRLSGRATFEAGVRFESTRASARDNPTSITWNSALPRAMFRVNLTPGGALALYTGYGMYRHRLPLDYLAYGDASAPSARVYRWDDPNGDGQVESSEFGTLVARSGPGRRSDYATSIDSGLKAPRTDEFAIGFDARLGRRWRLRLAAIERRIRRLVAPVNTGVTLADYTAREIWDRGNDFLNPVDDRFLTVYDRNPSSFGRDELFLTNPADHHAYGPGIDLALERVFDGRWYTLFAASAQRSDGYGGNIGFLSSENDTGVLGDAFVNPNALSYQRGRPFFERGYIIKWSGGFVTSHDLHVGAIARYQDGQHFARLVLVPDLNQGLEAIQAYNRGHSRFTFTFTLDARVEKGFRVGRSRLALVAEAFNLLNHTLEVEEDPVVTRKFRATTAVQPPRAIRLGVHVGF